MKIISFVLLSLLFTSCNNNYQKKIEYKGSDLLTLEALYDVRFNLKDTFFNSNNFIKDKEIIVNSYRKNKTFYAFDDKLSFPFIYYEGPIEIIPLYCIKVKDYYLVLISYGPMSTSKIYSEIFAFVLDDNNKIHDFKSVGEYVTGTGDIKDYLFSHFVLKFKKAGFTELKVTDLGFKINTSLLKVYYNKTEEIQNKLYDYTINESGKVQLNNIDSVSFIYYKNNIIDTNHNFVYQRLNN